jgi:hypothetical protein
MNIDFEGLFVTRRCIGPGESFASEPDQYLQHVQVRTIVVALLAITFCMFAILYRPGVVAETKSGQLSSTTSHA